MFENAISKLRCALSDYHTYPYSSISHTYANYERKKRPSNNNAHYHSTIEGEGKTGEHAYKKAATATQQPIQPI